MPYFWQSRWVLASISSFLLFVILSAATTNVDAQQKSKPTTASEKSPIEKLGRMIVGTWAIDATLEPDEAGSKPRKDVGKSVIRFGPGKLALTEDFRTNGDQGTQVSSVGR